MIAEVRLCRDDGTVLTQAIVHGPKPGGFIFPVDHQIVEDGVIYYGFELTFKCKAPAARSERTP